MLLTYERVQHNALTGNFALSPLRNIKTSNMFFPSLGHYHDLLVIDTNAL
jgi:hypothetical protein